MTALLCLLAAAAAAATPQAEPRPGQRPGATATLPAVRTELVQIDVVVTGKDGRCVDGIAQGEFEVLEDGKPQTLSHFAVEARPGLRAEAAAPPAPEAAPFPAPAQAPPTPRGRFFVLAVDDLHTAPGNMAEARRAMTRFVDEQVSDDDLVALATTSGTAGVFQDFTRDKAALRRAIARVQSRYEPVEPGGAPYLSEYQAELIDRSDVEALRLAVEEILQTEDYLGEVGAREKAYAQARRMVFEIMARTGRALTTIQGLVQGLAPLPGRKVVVLASDGFLVGLGAAENRAFDVRRITDAATRSGVVLYSLDTRGLSADVPGGSASFQGPAVLTAPGARQSLQTRGNEAQRQALNALAEDTGGFSSATPTTSPRASAGSCATTRSTTCSPTSPRTPPATGSSGRSRSGSGPGRACASGRGAATSLPTIARRRRKPRAPRPSGSARSARPSARSSRSRACRCG